MREGKRVRELTRHELTRLEHELRQELERFQRDVGDEGPSPRRDLARQEQIGFALRRIEEGSYGRCAACGNAIDHGRLSLVPEAATCMACAVRR